MKIQAYPHYRKEQNLKERSNNLPGLKILMHFVIDFTAVRVSEPAK